MAEDEFGGDHCLVPGGYSQIISILQNGLDILYDSSVQRISIEKENNNNGRKTVSIYTSNGIVKAKKVVVTVSIGVLKSGHLRFDPPLPSRKLASLNKLTMSRFNKIILRFNTKFWNDSCPGFILENEANLHSKKLFLFDTISHFSSEPVLVGEFVFDSFASEEDVVANALSQLKEMFGEENVGVPEKVHVTNWSADPFALGSYTAMPIGPHHHYLSVKPFLI